MRAVRRQVFAVPYTSFGEAEGSPQARATRDPARLGLRPPPPRRPTRHEGGSKACAATTRRRGDTSGRGSPSGSRARAAGVRAPPAPAPRAARGGASGRAAAELDGRRAIAVMPAGSGAPVPLSVGRLLDRDPRRARAALPRRGLHARRPAQARRRTDGQRDHARRGGPASGRAGPRSTPSTGRSSSSSPRSRRRGCSSRRTPGSGSRPSRSARRGSRSREETGTSTSSTASRSTPCCRRAPSIRPSSTAGRCRWSRRTSTARARGRGR